MPSKASIIREYLVKYPDLGPTELAKKIIAEHKGLKVRTQEISTNKTALAKKKMQAPPTPKATARTDLPARLATLKAAADAVGGAEAAKQILDMLQ